MVFEKRYLVCFIFVLINGVCGNENNLDNYITSSRSECFSSKNLISCVKYKTARFIWSVATGQVQLIKNPIFNEHFHLIPITNNDADGTDFSEYRFQSGMQCNAKLFIIYELASVKRVLI